MPFQLLAALAEGSTRALYAGDLRRLLKEAGFESVRIAGGFDRRPFERDTDELVIEASVRGQ